MLVATVAAGNLIAAPTKERQVETRPRGIRERPCRRRGLRCGRGIWALRVGAEWYERPWTAEQHGERDGQDGPGKG